MANLRINIAANYVGKCWSAISVFIFIPLYLRFLGIEAYGIVGFYAVLQGVLAVADMGLTSTLTREVASLSGINDQNSAREMRIVVRTIETIYLAIALLIAVGIFALAGPIAHHWLTPKALSVKVIQQSVCLMGLAASMQLPSMMYQGGLIGLQRQVLNNTILVIIGILRGGGAVLILWLISPTLQAFFLWQVLTNITFLLLGRTCLWRSLPSCGESAHFSREVLKRVGPYALGMMGISLNAILLTQVDKVSVSKLLPLEMLGYYTLAGAVASLPQMLAAPIASAVFPQLTGCVAVKDQAGLCRLYHRTCGLLAVVVLPAGLTMAMFAPDFIFAWTGSVTTAQRAGLVASFLLGGQLMQAIAMVPFYLALAHGNIKLNLQIGAISVVLITPLLIYLIMKYGVVGGGCSWLLMNLCTVPIYMYFLHRRFLAGEFRSWLLRDIGRPLAVALPIILLSRWILPSPSSRLLTFGVIGSVWGMSAVATGFTIPELRREFIRKTGKLFGVSYGMEI